MNLNSTEYKLGLYSALGHKNVKKYQVQASEYKMFFNVVTTDPKNESSEIRNYFCDIFMTDKNHKWQQEVLCLQLICTIYETTLLKSAQYAALKSRLKDH